MEVVEAAVKAKTKKFKTNRKKVVDAINKLLHNLVSLLLTNKTIRSDANSAKRV
ncbi:hypothetical protein [Herbaspirillum rubrisubalbicans]|uniref:hypothetical protein n=1 Tax=Herbaspirillum rubrisubalbicans TaxID=80842 RepID=UPI0015C53E2D|nr:hypothetical protein [Herbaspirillum rubrisubalbicans]